jgi:hypothetical protein
VNAVPPGLIVSCRPAAEPLAVTVMVTVAPALIVPLEELSCTVPDPLDTVLDHVTGPPCAVSEIVEPPGGTHSVPPDGETDRVPWATVAVGVGVDDAWPVADGVGVADGGAAGVLAWFVAAGVRCGAVVAERVDVGAAELAADVAGETPDDAAGDGRVGGGEPAGCESGCFPCAEPSVSATATPAMTAAATRPVAMTTRLLRRAGLPSSPPAGASFASFGSGGGLGKPWESNGTV